MCLFIFASYVWPHQRRPIMKLPGNYNYTGVRSLDNANKQFHNPVERWTDTESKSRRTLFFNDQTSSIYKCFGNDWKKYTIIIRRGQMGQFPRLMYECNALSLLPPGSVWATVEITVGVCQLTGWAFDPDDAQASHTLGEHYQLSLHNAIHNMRTDHQYVQCF